MPVDEQLAVPRAAADQRPADGDGGRSGGVAPPPAASGPQRAGGAGARVLDPPQRPALHPLPHLLAGR